MSIKPVDENDRSAEAPSSETSCLNSRQRAFPVIALVVCAVLINSFVVWFASAEHTLYVADQVRHWSFAVSFHDALLTDPVAAFGSAARDIARREVTVLPSIPIAFAMLVLGTSRFVYLLAVTNLYGIPSIVLLGFAASSLSRRTVGATGPLRTTTLLISAGVLCGAWIPVFIGYLGFGGVLLASAALWLYLRVDQQELSLSDGAVIGALIALAVLFRRWYAIFAVSALLAFALDALVHVILSGSRSVKSAALRLARPAIIAAASAATLLATAWPMMFGIVRRDYVDNFSAFREHGTFVQAIGAVSSDHGWAVLALLVGCFAILLAAGSTRRIALVLSIQMASAFFFFQRIQTHDVHHWYLYLPAATLLTTLGLARGISWLNPGIRRGIAVTVLGVLSLTQVCHVFLSIPKEDGGWLVGGQIRPAQRGDIDEIARMLAYMDRVLAEHPGYIYVLGVYPSLSDHLLAFANLSLGANFTTPRSILAASHLDRRDGFPGGLLEARYIIVGEPLRIAQPEVCRVLEIPAGYFTARRALANAFVPLPAEFHLDGDVTARVWARTRPNSPQEVERLRADLRAFYPHRPDIFGGEEVAPGQRAPSSD